MELTFYKYQGTGNDFVMVDNRTKVIDASNHELVAKLCHRRFGVGADGLILLENAEGYDFKMVYFNADGKEGSMCGNGGRCIVQFAYDIGIIGDKTTFVAVDGPHSAYINNALVHLKMIDVFSIEKYGNDFFMNTGSPHYITVVDNIADTNVVEEGRKIRYDKKFSTGTNVNFIEQKDKSLYVRTYERGVEDETYSCGTGVTAAAIAASQLGAKSPISVHTMGGELSVSFKRQENQYSEIYLVGPAKKVYDGKIEI
jgi:diaminopimelate epimerase